MLYLGFMSHVSATTAMNTWQAPATHGKYGKQQKTRTKLGQKDQPTQTGGITTATYRLGDATTLWEEEREGENSQGGGTQEPKEGRGPTVPAGRPNRRRGGGGGRELQTHNNLDVPAQREKLSKPIAPWKRKITQQTNGSREGGERRLPHTTLAN